MSFGPFEAVVFDLDGVIVDSEPRHERAFLQVFEEIGFGADHGMDFSAYLGRSDRDLWEDFVARHRPSQPIDELLARKERTLIALLEAERPVYEGLPGLVRDLARRYPLAVASGSRHAVIEAVLGLAGIRDAFDAVASVQDVGRAKPAPDVFLLAARKLGLPAERCCAIEDTVAGIESARAAGLAVIAVPHTYPEAALTRASRVVPDLSGIRRLLLPGD
ncbi:MAG: HAD family phosphatase [Verrucomicrobiales bacterium]|nr:HAD family phosphatase [Verrucomicrobiales bacterium]